MSRQTCKYRDRIAREEQRSSRGPVAPFSRVVRPQRRCCLPAVVADKPEFAADLHEVLKRNPEVAALADPVSCSASVAGLARALESVDESPQVK